MTTRLDSFETITEDFKRWREVQALSRSLPSNLSAPKSLVDLFFLEPPGPISEVSTVVGLLQLWSTPPEVIEAYICDRFHSPDGSVRRH